MDDIFEKGCFNCRNNNDYDPSIFCDDCIDYCNWELDIATLSDGEEDATVQNKII